MDCINTRGTLAVCIREVQKSLKESAKRLIEVKLEQFGLGEADGFKVFREVIQTPGDGLISFQGMQDHTAESIKSLEGYSRAWVEEGQTLSERSLALLRPTIRAEGSELWFSWNPRKKTDPVDEMLRGEKRPTGSCVVKANWSDNPWFPSVLEQERQDCRVNDPEQYDHIWEGGYVKAVKGAYYAPHLAEARREGRVTKLGMDPHMQLRAWWDIGGTGAKADACAIWVGQYTGKTIHFLDYYEAQGQPLAAHIEWLRGNKYEKALCVLPHDGATNDRVYDVSYESALRGAQFNTIVIPNQGKGAAGKRIDRARQLFPRMWFDEKTEPGLEALGWYHEKRDDERQVGLGPEHDWSSHGADAFGLAAVAYEEPRSMRKLNFRSPVGTVA